MADLTALDKATAAVLADPKAARTVKNYATEATKAIHALNPTPPPPSTGANPGIGIVRFGNILWNTSHLTDYQLIVGNTGDEGILAPLTQAATFIYQNLGPDSPHLDLSDPQRLVNWTTNLPGKIGVCLDNCMAKNAAAILPYMASACPPIIAAGRPVYVNASGWGGPGDYNTGDADRQWYARLKGLVTHISCEAWEQIEAPGGAVQLRVGADWQAWQANPAAAHAAGAAFVGNVFGGTVGEQNAVNGRASLALVSAPGDVCCYLPGAWNVVDTTDPWGAKWTVTLGDATSPAGDNPRGFANGEAGVTVSTQTGFLFGKPV